MKFELGIVNDIYALIEIIKERMLWMDNNNINQWNNQNYLSLFDEDYFKKKINNNEFYVVKCGSNVLGGVVLLNYDKSWDDNVCAIYMHNLVTKVSSKGVGDFILSNVEKLAKLNDIDRIRLDCQGDNLKLNRYYEEKSFKLVGLCELPGYIGNKREKILNEVK